MKEALNMLVGTIEGCVLVPIEKLVFSSSSLAPLIHHEGFPEEVFLPAHEIHSFNRYELGEGFYGMKVEPFVLHGVLNTNPDERVDFSLELVGKCSIIPTRTSSTIIGKPLLFVGGVLKV